ncbi:hypothetical protein [Ensifer canadensis]
MTMIINRIYSITATEEPNAFMVDADIEVSGERFRSKHAYRESDPHGLSPVIKQWIANHPDFLIGSYMTPAAQTPEEVREQIPALTARQFRLGLVAGGYAPAQVIKAIDTMPDGTAKETAKIEWEYAATFNRTHPLIATVAVALGLNDSQIDAMWLTAVNL